MTQGYRVVAPDQRGYSAGARPLTVADYGLHHLVDDVLALADALEMETFDLVGHDWGGMVSWVAAARHPDRVRSLSVVSTPHPLALRGALVGGDPAQAGRSAQMDAFRQPEVPERLLLGDDRSGSGLEALCAASGLRPADTRQYLAVLTQPGALTAALNWYRAMDGNELADLPLVTVPTLYVWSTDDAGARPARRRSVGPLRLGPLPLRRARGRRSLDSRGGPQGAGPVADRAPGHDLKQSAGGAGTHR